MDLFSDTAGVRAYIESNGCRCSDARKVSLICVVLYVSLVIKVNVLQLIFI